MNMIKIFQNLIFLTILFSSYAAGQNLNYVNRQDSTVTISISAVGDLMCHSIEYNYARIKADSFNFAPMYQYISQYLSESDFTFGNLETVLAGNSFPYSGYPHFNTPDDFLTPLKTAGFDLLSTANNHALDRGAKGLLRTIAQLKKHGIKYNGTFNSQRDRDSIRIFNIKGIKVAFLAYTFGTNGNRIPKSYLINLIDTSLIKKDIHSAKQEGAELVLVHYHFGTEYKRLPSIYQKDVVDNTIKYGADIIIGGHPHVVETASFFKTKNGDLDSGFVAYSLGNFISNQRWRYSDAGVILTLNITKDFTKDSIYISSVDYLPTWVFKGETKKGRRYFILPAQEAFSDSSYSFLTKSDISKMKQAFNDTKNILTKFAPKIHLDNIFWNDILYQPAVKNYELIPFQMFNKIKLSEK